MATQKHGKGKGFLGSTAEEAMIEARRDAARMLHGMRGIVKLEDLYKLRAKIVSNRKRARKAADEYWDASRRLDKLYHNAPNPRTPEYDAELTRLFEDRREVEQLQNAIRREYFRLADEQERLLKQYNEQESLNPPEDNDLMD
jgi:hypothetical protein